MKQSLLSAFLLLLTLGCSLEYGNTDLSSEKPEEVPDTVLYGVTHTIVTDGAPRFVVRADRAETFGEANRQYLYGVEFRELAKDGTLITEGSGAFAEYATDTDNIEIRGELEFFSYEQDAFLTAEVLFWDDETRVLTSEPADPVRLRRGDGTTVRGRGFVAEMGRSIIRFEDGVSGTIIEQDDE